MNWDMVKLGDLCEILDTLRKPITKKFRKAGKYPYYGATGIVDWVDDYIFEEELVLVGEDGAKWDAGEKTAFIVDGKYWVNNHAHVIKPNKDKLLKKWLTYYLCGIDLTPWITGLTVPKLNQAQLKSIPIPLPPLEEQQRIVDKLDSAFAEIDDAKNCNEVNLKNIEIFKQTFLSNCLKEKIKEILPLSKVISKTETVNPNNKPEDNFIYIDVSSVDRETCKISKVQNLLGKNAPSRARRLIRENDIIFATVRPTLKRIAIVTSEYNQQVCSTGYFVLRANEEILSTKYLFYYMQSNKVLSIMEKNQTGASYPAVNDKQIKEITIGLPNLEFQEKIVMKIEQIFFQINKLKKNLQKNISNYQSLKNKILYKELKNNTV